jgi:hypothetical protein
LKPVSDCQIVIQKTSNQSTNHKAVNTRLNVQVYRSSLLLSLDVDVDDDDEELSGGRGAGKPTGTACSNMFASCVRPPALLLHWDLEKLLQNLGS